MAIVDESLEELPTFQITLTSSKQPTTIRQLLSSQVSRVVMIPGIVISTSKVKAKATTVVAQCKGCQGMKQIAVRAGFAGAALPRKCDEPRQPGEAQCPIDPYSIMPERCKYVDMQTWKLQVCSAAPPLAAQAAHSSARQRSDRTTALRASAPGPRAPRPRPTLRIGLPRCPFRNRPSAPFSAAVQESPEQVPTGEMPRSVMLSVDRHLVDRAIPGHRVTVTGIMSIMATAGKSGGGSGVAIRQPYLQVLGIRHGFDATDSTGASLDSFTNAEEQEFRDLCAGAAHFMRTVGGGGGPSPLPQFSHR